MAQARATAAGPLHAGGVPASAPVAATPVDERRIGALRYGSMMIAAALLLQRFGLPLGIRHFNLVGPVGIVLSIWGIANGTLALNRFRSIMFMVLGICSVAGLGWHALQPSVGMDVAAQPSLDSLLQFLLVTSVAMLSFAEPVDEAAFFRVINFWFAFVAVAGILQFVAQFAGLDLMSFTGYLPDNLLFEAGYNLRIGLGVGHLLKSNGFFLLEPSIMSQIMALGLIIEVLTFRRPLYLALFVAGMLLSFSGTGWIVLASFILAATFAMGWRGMTIAIATVVVLGLLLAACSFLFPDIFNAVMSRAGEISQPGTSGHLRFVTPFWALADIMASHPDAAMVGLGSGVSEHLNLPYEYDVNTPIKTVLEFGFPALIAYVLLILGGRKSPVQGALLVPCAVMFFFTGAYQQFAPILFPVLLLIGIARLEPASPAGHPARASS